MNIKSERRILMIGTKDAEIYNMKTSELKPKEKTIVLGVFSTITFRYINKLPNVYGYGTFHEWHSNRYATILEQVEMAGHIADMIIFILDDVHFPIDPSISITCKELELICKDDELFNKTVFVKGDNVIDFDKNLVL